MTQKNKSRILGVTGGIGSGKSRVLSYLEDTYNATVFYADLIAADLEEPGEDCYKRIVDLFGTDILDFNEEIDRKILSSIVFSDQEKMAKLDEIVHPAVKDNILEMIRILDGKVPFFVIEAALLLEAGYGEICDEIWYIYAPEDVRTKRLLQSRDYDEKKVISIMKSQLKDEDFRLGCTRVIDNSGDFSNTKEQIDEILASCADLW